MVSGNLPETVAAGLLLLAAVYGYILSTSKTEDPKSRLLNSMLRSAAGDHHDFRHRCAA